jgi:hypothetical protein
MSAQFIAIVPVTTPAAGDKYEPEGYDCRDDNEPVLRGSELGP